MPQVLVIESGEPVLREFRVSTMTPRQRISLKYQQRLIDRQKKARKEVPFADGRTLNIVFDI